MWRSRRRNAILGVLSLMIVLLIGASVSISRLDDQIIRSAGPEEGYYWTVAQYQLAYLQMREAMKIVALDGNIDDDEVARRIAVWMSKASILTGDSELTDSFKAIPGFASRTQEILAFHRHAERSLDTPADMRPRARELLDEFAGIEPTILSLVNEVRLEEIRARSSILDSLLFRRQLLYAALWAGFAAMLWVVIVSISWSRHLREAKAREQALDAERRAVQAKTQFLGMVSHELRSPLQSIVSALDVLESRHALPDQAEVTRRIRRSANELAVQLRDLLTLARGQAGRIELRPEVFEATELVREVAADSNADARARGLALTVTTPSDPLFVVADGARIGQLLHNLIGNAVKYTEHGGVVVRLREFEEAAATLHFSIVDTGPGLPASATATLAEGLELQPQGPRKGRGIGLAVVRALLQQLDGKVLLSKTAGGGTTIELVVPAVPAEERPPAKGSGEGRLLVVDDRRDLLEGFAQVSAELGLHCDTASSAATALNLLAAHVYDTVLIDLDMPGKSGADLAAEVRAGSLNSDIRLVAMSAGLVAPEDAVRAFDAVFEKPLDGPRLLAALAAPRRDAARRDPASASGAG
jgi:signal transduction histidine kinase/ActR/RegA family two-component response regulator